MRLNGTVQQENIDPLVNLVQTQPSPRPSRTQYSKSIRKRATLTSPINLKERIPLPTNTRLMYACMNDWIKAQLAAPCGYHNKYDTCSGKVRLVDSVDQEGHQVTIHLQCESNPAHLHDVHNYLSERVLGVEKKNSQEMKQNSGHFPINVLSVLSHTMAGVDHEAASTSESIMMGHWMESGLFYRIQNKLWTAVKLEFGESARAVQDRLLKSNQQWSLVADTGWGSRGNTAIHGSLPIIWYEDQLIV
jgi:hypothetical protein